MCFHGNHNKFYEMYSVWVISFLVSKVETQGEQQMDAFKRHYQVEVSVGCLSYSVATGTTWK